MNHLERESVFVAPIYMSLGSFLNLGGQLETKLGLDTGFSLKFSCHLFYES